MRFPNGEWCWPSFQGLSAICAPFSVKTCHVSIHVFCPFSNCVVCILLLVVESSLYILVTSSLSDMYANFFSHPVACLFILFTESFTEKRFSFQLRHFPFMNPAFGVKSKNSSCSPRSQRYSPFFPTSFIILHILMYIFKVCDPFGTNFYCIRYDVRLSFIFWPVSLQLL